MAQSLSPVSIPSLRWGLNDNDPPIALADDACTVAENVEFFYSTVGERRLGCAKISDLPTQYTGDPNIQAVTWMGAHYPTNNVADVELWALGQHLTSTNFTLNHRTSSAWSNVVPSDNITVTNGYGHRLSGVSLHGKFYIAYKATNSTDRLHVWDGTSLRATSLLAVANPPSASNTGSGSFSGTRYYRVREIVMSGPTVLLRSEPSSVLTFSPSGSGASALVTKPATTNSNATHWELEASTDNANFYRIAQTAIGTTTYTDSQAFNSGYAIIGVLSESLTSYTPLPSGKFLTVDSDRLLIGGSWENSVYGSRIWWTPTLANTGNGNDERLDMTVGPYMDLDGFEGGELTGLSRAVNGYLYAFKWGHIYKIVRTGLRTQAYSAIPITKSRGALPGSLVEAVDQGGNPAQYFLDPKVGPMRIGIYGLEWCGRDLRNTWSRVNLAATVPCHGVFYQFKNQVHYWIAVDGADYPNMKIVVQCNEMRSVPNDGARRGWSTVPTGNRISDAHCSISFPNNVDTTNPRNQLLVPYIGKQQWTVGSNTIKDLIQMCDTGTTDAFTSSDSVAYYYATVKSKPFSPAGLLTKFGALAGVIMAVAVSAPANSAYIKISKDFDAETLTLPINLVADSTETIVIRRLDNLSMSGISTVQFSFGDLDTNVSTPSTSWRLHTFQMKISPEQSM